MNIFAFAGFVQNVPILEDEEFIVLVEGFSEEEFATGVPDESQLHFAMTFLRKSRDAQEAQRQIERYWSDDLDLLSLQLISDDDCRFTRKLRRLAKQLAPDNGFLYPYKIGYKRDSDCAKEATFSIIRMAAVRKRWQFWR